MSRSAATEHQVDDLMNEVRSRVEAKERVLVTTLTKKMAEDLTDYLLEMGFKVRYLHSDIDTLQRIEIVRDLRLGEFDVLVGVNLLREGLDLPEVTLVAILDADKEGFLRGETALIQTIGRAARNVRGKVIMYADKMTGAMERAIDETDRRRGLQVAYNEEHGITPQTIVKGVSDMSAMLGESTGAVQGDPRPPCREEDEPAGTGRGHRHPRGGDVRGLGGTEVRIRRQAARSDQGTRASEGVQMTGDAGLFPPTLTATSSNAAAETIQPVPYNQ